jgi:hypothetical protein
MLQSSIPQFHHKNNKEDHPKHLLHHQPQAFLSSTTKTTKKITQSIYSIINHDRNAVKHQTILVAPYAEVAGSSSGIRRYRHSCSISRASSHHHHTKHKLNPNQNAEKNDGS